MNIIDLLLKKGLITSTDAKKAREMMGEEQKSAETVLKDMGVSVQKILEAKGEDLGIPTKLITDSAIPFEILRYLPEESANLYKMIPLALKDGILEVGIVDPENFEVEIE